MANINLEKVGGVCSILAALIAITGLIVLLVAVGDETNSDDVVERLLAINDDRASFATAQWFLSPLSPLLGLVAVLGFYHALRGSGTLVWVAVVAFMSGLLLLVVHGLIEIGVAYELAPGYAEANMTTKPSLEVVANTLDQISELALVVGHALSWGLGVALFGLATLRTAVVPKWIGWLGLVVGFLGGWLGLLEHVSVVFEITKRIGAQAYIVWLVAMGMSLLQLREHAASPREA